MSEQKNENVMLGAETFGVEPVFSASKWKVTGCIDWDIDHQYILDYPLEAEDNDSAVSLGWERVKELDLDSKIPIKNLRARLLPEKGED